MPGIRILITDGDTRAALAATRSLGRRHSVWVGSPGRSSLAGASRHATGRVILPQPLSAPDRFADTVVRHTRALDAAIVMPMTDAACGALIPARERLHPVRLAAPSASAYERLSDKGQATEQAVRHGLAVPRGGEARGTADACALARELGYPVVVKPLHSVAAGPGGALAKHRVVRVSGEDALCVRVAALGEAPLLIQECVQGWGEGLFVLRWAGRTRAVFAHRRLREKPPGGGVSVLSESIAVDAQRQRAVEAILDELDFEGLAMAELKSDGRRTWLMEFNARPWGSLQLAIDAGVDFPSLLVDCVLGRPPSKPPDYTVGARLRWCLGDLDHALALARGATATDGRRGPRAALRLLLGRTGPGTRFELLRRDDPRPFALAAWRWLRRREG